MATKGSTKEKIEPDIKPDFLNNDGSHDKGAISPEEQAKFDQIEKGEQDLARKEKHAGTSDGQGTPTNKKEEDLTKQARNDTVGKGYYSRGKGKKKSSRKKIIATIGVIGVTVSIFGAVAFLPTLFMKQMMSRLTGAFMDRVSYATQQRSEVYVKKYVTKVLGRSVSLSRCGTKITAECSVFDPNKGIASNLYRNWSNARIEDKLFEKHGLSFEFDSKNSNEVKVFKTNSFGDKELVGNFGKKTVSKEVSKLIETETRFEGVRDRRHLRNLLSRKYNASKWCFVFCDKRDAFKGSRLSVVKRLKLRLAARISKSVNAKLGSVLACFISDCTDADIKSENSKIGRRLAESFDSDVRANFAADLDSRGNPRLGQYLIQRSIEKVFGGFLEKTTIEGLTSAVPIAGQVYLALSVVDRLDRMDAYIKNRKLSEYLDTINAKEHVN